MKSTFEKVNAPAEVLFIIIIRLLSQLPAKIAFPNKSKNLRKGLVGPVFG